MAETVDVLNPAGELVSIPVEQVQQAQKFGYKVATADDIKLEQMKADYGGLGDQALAAVSGVASGATFGLSDIALSALGADEALKAYEALHGTERGVGKVAGAILPAFFTGGASTAANAARVGKAAAGAETIAAEALAAAKAAEATSGIRTLGNVAKTSITAMPRAADAGGKAVRAALNLQGRPILGTTVELAAQGAIEGAMQGAGEEAARLAMDNELSGEKVGQILLAGLEGAGVGLAVGAPLGALGGTAIYAGRQANKAITAATNKIKGVVSKLPDAVDGIAPQTWAKAKGQYYDFISKQTGADQGIAARVANDQAAARVAMNAEQEIDKVIPDIQAETTTWANRREVIREVVADPVFKSESVKAKLATGDAGDGVRFIDLQRAETLGQLEAASAMFGDMLSAPKGEFATAGVERTKGAIDKLLRLAKSAPYKAKPDDAGIRLFRYFDQAKRSVGDLVSKYGSVEANYGNNATRRKLQELYETMRLGAEKTNVWGDLGAYNAELNKSIFTMLSTNDDMSGAILRKFDRSAFDPWSKALAADGDKLRAMVAATNKNQVNFASVAYRKTLEADRNTLKIMLRDIDFPALEKQYAKRGRQPPNMRREMEAQVKSIEKNLALLDKAEESARLGNWFNQVGGSKDSFTAMLGAAALGATVGFGPAALLAAPLLRPQIAVRAIEGIERIAKNQDDKVNKAVREAFKRMKQAGTKIGEVGGRAVETAAAAGRAAQRGTAATTRRFGGAAARANAFYDTRNRVQQAAAALPAIRAQVDAQTAWLAGQAPVARQAAGDTLYRGVGYLARVAPGQTVSGVPFSEPIPPTAQEQISFMRKVRAVKNPMVLLDDLRDGKLTEDTIEAVRETYPEMLGEMQAKVAEQVADMSARGEVPTMADRVSLSLLMGAPMTPEMSPDFIRTAQSIYAQETPEQRQGGVTPQRAPNFAANYESGAQETATAT